MDLQRVVGGHGASLASLGALQTDLGLPGRSGVESTGCQAPCGVLGRRHPAPLSWMPGWGAATLRALLVHSACRPNSGGVLRGCGEQAGATRVGAAGGG